MKERINRMSWQKMFMEIAKIVAQRSSDPKTQVGAVIVKDNRILSIGYNGAISGFNFDFDWTTAEKYKFCVHAEANALSNAAKIGANVDSADIYLTLSPCQECIKLLIQAGIKNIYYTNQYRSFEITKLIADNTPLINLIQVDEEKL